MKKSLLKVLKTVKLTKSQNILIKELENVFYNFFYASQLFQRSKVSSSSVVPSIAYVKEELRDEKNYANARKV